MNMRMAKMHFFVDDTRLYSADSSLSKAVEVIQTTIQQLQEALLLKVGA